LLKTYCIAIFKFAISLLILILHALVSQMYQEVFILGVVIRRSSAYIAFLIYENSEVISQDSPHTNIKFSVMEKQRFFYILLYDPIGYFAVTGQHIVRYLSEFVENLYTFSLIGICWLHEPHIIFTVFPRHAFFVSATFIKLVKSMQHRRDFAII
jgi:hypothetical protein